jgi:elongation factor Ts
VKTASSIIHSSLLIFNYLMESNMGTAELVKELREKTGAGFAECKKALDETKGDIAKATEALQKAGLAKAAKKSGRIAAEGLVQSYVHSNNRIGVLVEVNCETDFVARNDDFKEFARDVAMQIAAMNPQFVKSEEIAPAEIDKQRELHKASPDLAGKPDNIAQRIIDGKIKKWFQEVCLLDQPFVKDDKTTLGKLQTDLTAKIGEKISVRRFVRFEVGEGLEKRVDNFAEEVAKQAGTK